MAVFILVIRVLVADHCLGNRNEDCGILGGHESSDNRDVILAALFHRLAKQLSGHILGVFAARNDGGNLFVAEHIGQTVGAEQEHIAVMNIVNNADIRLERTFLGESAEMLCQALGVGHVADIRLSCFARVNYLLGVSVIETRLLENTVREVIDSRIAYAYAYNLALGGVDTRKGCTHSLAASGVDFIAYFIIRLIEIA